MELESVFQRGKSHYRFIDDEGRKRLRCRAASGDCICVASGPAPEGENSQTPTTINKRGIAGSLLMILKRGRSAVCVTPTHFDPPATFLGRPPSRPPSGHSKIKDLLPPGSSIVSILVPSSSRRRVHTTRGIGRRGPGGQPPPHGNDNDTAAGHGSLPIPRQQLVIWGWTKVSGRGRGSLPRCKC